MAALTTAVRPYARASFSYAKEKNALEQWTQALGALAEVYRYPDVAAHLALPSLSAQARVDVLKELCEGLLDEPLCNFLYILAEHYRLPLLPEINRFFADLVAQQKQLLEVNLAVADETEDSVVEMLRARLQKSTGCDIQLNIKVDPDLIAGGVVRIGDTVIDGSLRGHLRQLVQAL